MRAFAGECVGSFICFSVGELVVVVVVVSAAVVVVVVCVDMAW